MFPEKFFRALSGDDTLSFFSCIATAVHQTLNTDFCIRMNIPDIVTKFLIMFFQKKCCLYHKQSAEIS